MSIRHFCYSTFFPITRTKGQYYLMIREELVFIHAAHVLISCSTQRTVCTYSAIVTQQLNGLYAAKQHSYISLSSLVTFISSSFVSSFCCIWKTRCASHRREFSPAFLHYDDRELNFSLMNNHPKSGFIAKQSSRVKFFYKLLGKTSKRIQIF